MCRDAQDEETKTAPLQSTGDNVLVADCTNESGVIADYLEDDNFGKILSSPGMTSKSSSPKARKSPLDLSPENFFMTPNEMNGKWRKIAVNKSFKTNKTQKIGYRTFIKLPDWNIKTQIISQRELFLWLPFHPFARHHSLSSCSAMQISLIVRSEPINMRCLCVTLVVHVAYVIGGGHFP